MQTLLALISRALCFAAIGAIALATTASTAEPFRTTHGSGDMAMSADGRLVAFTATGQPANEFMVFDTVDRTATIVVTPANHVGELGWSPDGDELTFVTAERHTIGGEGRHVWRLRPNAAGPVIELLALIPYVRSPVLNAEGDRLAAFEGVVAGDGRPIGLNVAYAIFERTLADGQFTRRSEGHASDGNLQYDRQGVLFVRLSEPVFPSASRYGANIVYGWRSHDAAGRRDFQWRADVGPGRSFHLPPGKMLPAWPSPLRTPGIRESSLVRPLDDGRIALYASNNPTSIIDWYDERGQARPRPRPGPLPYDYVAQADDGTVEVLFSRPLPEGAGRTGGADISADGKVLAQIIARLGEPDRHKLMVFERGTLSFEILVADLAARAERIVVAPSETPLMPAVSDLHRVSVEPPPEISNGGGPL